MDRRPVTCANAFTGSGGFEVCGECARKLPYTPPCWPDCRRADLRVCRGRGYVIAVETNTIALDNSGVTRRLAPTETNGPFRSSTLACGLAKDVPERESPRHGSCGRSCIDTAAVCAVVARRSASGTMTVSSVAGRDAPDRPSGTTPPRRATVPVRKGRRVALPSGDDQHHGRAAGVPGGPPPSPCPGRGPDPPRDGLRPGTLPLRNCAINTAWAQLAAISADLIAWLRLLALTPQLAKAELKALRSGSCTYPPD